MSKKLITLAALLLLLCTVGCGKKSNEKELTTNVGKMGKIFYEEFYYPQMENTQEDVKSFMAKFEKAGIKVNLANLSKLSKVDKKLVESMVNSKTKEKCNEEKTSVRIIPKSPYGKTDYEIEVTLDCGFEK